MDRLQFEEFLKTQNAAEIHLSSYNYFVTHELPVVVQNFPIRLSAPGDAYYELEIYGVHCAKACMLKNGVYRPITPAICRRDNLSYMSPVFATVQQTKYDTHHRKLQTTVAKKVVIAHIPVMVRSCLCHTTSSREVGEQESADPGGYFIINGVERVLVTQRRKCYNFPQVVENNGALTVNLRSISRETSHSVLVEITTTRESDDYYCTVPYVGKKVPLEILICAFGSSMNKLNEDIDTFVGTSTGVTEEQALAWINSHVTTKPNVETTESIADEEESSDSESLTESEISETSAAAEIRLEQTNVARQILQYELFPHVGLGAPLYIKYRTLCSMIRKLVLTKQNQVFPDNIDNLFFHRFETSGILLGELFTMLFRNFLNTVRECSKSGSITDFTNKLELFITKNIKTCMAKGKWGVQKASYVRQGVSQQLSRFSILGTLSHLHRLMLPIGKEGKNTKARQIHPSQFGYICLFETPEGQNCGIVLNFTSAVRITRDYAAPFVRDVVKPLLSTEGTIDVWIDNVFLMHTNDAGEFVSRFRQLRRKGLIPWCFSCHVYEDRKRRPYEIRIFADKGRVMRPLLDAEGHITYLDPAESQNCVIAMSKFETGWDYCELHPTLLLSICAASIPFLNHMQSPRIVYESSMLKQTIGIYPYTYAHRYDTTCEILDYTQKSLVSTIIGRTFGMHDAPAGINCVVAIMTMGSWNAEDCIVINKAAVDRGLFSSMTYKTITVEEYKPKTNDIRRFCLPPENIRKPIYNYDLLDANGIVRKGSVVSRKDVIVGCIQEIIRKGSKRDILEKDCSELADEEGIVEFVKVSQTFCGNRIVNIVLKIRKIPERGDKFANLNAQKGTCGIMLAPEDMPFCLEDGIVPDILVNPHALPSRMTISMFLEMVTGQECCLTGTFRDATAFEPIEQIGDQLKSFGYDSCGFKRLTDGCTGNMLTAKIFMGTNYYQKLKHMVSNKINARNFGNVTISTRQPVSGRSKQGGIRAGEMEVQGWLSHGVSDFLKERLFDCSDRFTIFVCNKCQVLSNHKDQCHVCQGEVIETNMPYASKIVFQLLNMCLIKTSFKITLI